MQEPQKPFRWIVISTLIIIPLIAGLVTLRDYGESWDEASKRSYADYALDAYQYFLHPKDLQPYGNELNYYGPAYFVLAALAARGLTALIPVWTVVTAWHFVYFITFLVGVYLLYLLACRWMSPWAASGAALLYCAQPLLWGHAFINPKDTPFTTFFLASLYLGFKMVDEQDKRWFWTILAGFVLGLSTSFRILAPYSALLITHYALRITGRKSIPQLFIYAITALATMYLAWPYLWLDPIGHFTDSLRVMSAFPFDQTVLFQGELYPANGLPLSYLPTLLRLQLTEPLLILSAFGLLISVNRFIDKDRSTLALFTFWFLFPVTAIVVSGNTLYDNFRQLFFLLPPLFILTGLPLDYLFKKIDSNLARVFIVLILTLPGIISALRLHPYEYVYYNSFVGGTRGAFRDFETDYWDTSFTEAAQYLNQVAPENASVIVIGSVDLFREYARPDLKVYSIGALKDQQGKYDYVVIHSRRNLDERRCKEAQTIYTVERQGAIFAVVKKLTAEGQCP